MLYVHVFYACIHVHMHLEYCICTLDAFIKYPAQTASKDSGRTDD